MGSADALAQVNSLAELTELVVSGNDAATGQITPGSDPFAGITEEERAALAFSNLEELRNILWLACDGAIISDNKLNTQALTEYLKAIKAISDKYNLTELQQGGTGGHIAMAFSSADGGTALELSTSLIYYTMQRTNYGAFTASNFQLMGMMMDRAGSQLIGFPGLSSGAWKPSTMVSINADTSSEDLAAAFITTLLSMDVQQLNYGEGLPVTRSGVAAQIDAINASMEENNLGSFDLDIDALITQLETPSMSDSVLGGMMWGAIEKLCKGDTDVEGAVKEIEQSIKNYLAERA
jgi:hypothetical protein